MGPNKIFSKQNNMLPPVSSEKDSEQRVSTEKKIIIKYGDVDKGNRLYSAMENVKSSQGMAQEHVEAVNPQNNM